ncbi:hypothetical protein PSHI8_10540 [Polynucleobacter sp. SHI8]|uniref:DUF6279 family lipoprotein n=1 Tax=unclassified Polynucleobacter TaxID=2640945 RepID=UPI0024908E6B|nr:MULTISPECIES: DUF6279 family lipoprotein [unclassified Polynucleobacter]BDW10972.1 hypothetical protein PSHI2_10540 [Polynucleobacter sp. SHI2]BDW13418.1 hypothetical protein PSHI8_10540 [Polynucleobacter sp. SHI8]
MIKLKTKRLFLTCAVFCSFLLSSCSSIQLAYNQIDFLLKWWIDDYVDLTAEQSQIYDQAIPLVVKKHRQEELPKALQFIRQLKAKVEQPLQIDDGINIVKDIKSFSRTSINLLQDDAVNLALSLQAKQFTYMENAFAKSNKKFQNDFLKGTTEDRLEKRVEKIIERTESFSGNLTKSQKTQIKEIAREYLLDMEMVYQTRLYKQQLIMKTLKKIAQDQPPPAQAKMIINQLSNEIELGSTPEQKEFEKKRDLHSGIVLAKITELFDEQQRKKTQAKIRSWEQDIQKLIQQASKT